MKNNPRKGTLAPKITALALALAAGPAAQGWADTDVFANDVLWSYSYDGNVLPDDPLADPEWSLQSQTAGSSASVNGGILTLSTAEMTDSISYRQYGPSYWNPTGIGTTIEVRLKIDSQVPGSEWAQTMIINTGVKSFLIGWRDNRVQDFNGSHNVAMNTTDDFHIYRFVVTGLDSLALYVDNSPTAAFSSTGGDWAENALEFGKTGILPWGAGVGQWDYVRWTNEGAFAPVPEPSTLLLGGIGLIGVWAYRRSRQRGAKQVD